MKKERRNGRIYITSDAEAPFINSNMALMAAMTLQMYFQSQGYLTTSSTYLPHKRIEVTVHFDTMPVAPIPRGYIYTYKEITSNLYFSDASKSPERCRVMTFYFNYE